MASNCKTGCLDLHFQAKESQASEGIATLSTRLAEIGLPANKADDVKIALAEAINNIVEHAYAATAPADVQVYCCLCTDKLDVHIWDTGKPMPNLRLPEGLPVAVDTSRQDLPEGGFGWFLIRRLASDIGYHRVDGCNVLYLRFDFTEFS